MKTHLVSLPYTDGTVRCSSVVVKNESVQEKYFKFDIPDIHLPRIISVNHIFPVRYSHGYNRLLMTKNMRNPSNFSLHSDTRRCLFMSFIIPACNGPYSQPFVHSFCPIFSQKLVN